MIKNLKNKKKKLSYILGGVSSAIALSLTTSIIEADSAGDKMKDIITKAGSETQNLGNLIGGTIAGCISAICGIAALFIVGKGAYKSWKNHGVESVFEESGTAIGVLAIVAVVAGIVASVFFNA